MELLVSSSVIYTAYVTMKATHVRLPEKIKIHQPLVSQPKYSTYCM